MSIDKNPLVSVIIPIFNIEQYIEQCIVSIINQSYKNIEIILVNDASTDNSGILCDKYTYIDKRIKVVHHKNNLGLVSARKTGLLNSNGVYILYVDGDDWIKKSCIQTYVDAAVQHNCDMVISSHFEELGNTLTVLHNSIEDGYYDKNNLIEKIYPTMICGSRFSEFGIFSYIWGKLIKRSIILNNQLNVDNNIFIGEDAACLYPTLLDVNSILIMSNPMYIYRQRTNSLIKTEKRNEIEKINILYKYLVQVFSNKKYLNILLPQVKMFILNLLTVRAEKTTNLNQYPFKNIRNSKIIIYGAGTFGQHLYKRLAKTEDISIVSWIDEMYDSYSKLGLPIKDTESISNLKFDKIIIALINENISNSAKNLLIKKGIDKKKIVQVAYDSIKNIDMLLSEYNINNI